jgi:hypothetical protein
MKFRIKGKMNPLEIPAIIKKEKPVRRPFEGGRWIDFAIDETLWNEFVARYCKEKRPNEVFIELIKREVNNDL